VAYSSVSGYARWTVADGVAAPTDDKIDQCGTEGPPTAERQMIIATALARGFLAPEACRGPHL